MVHSLITLYSPTETEFETNGLGALSEAVTCIVTEEANGAFELELVYPITGKRFNDIQKRCIIFTKPNPIDPPQAFRIYEYSKPMDGLVTYRAEHISYDLSGYPVEPFRANSCIEAFENLKTKSVLEHPFNFWTDIESDASLSVTVPSSTRSILGGSENSILDIYKGEYKFDNFEVKLYKNRGSERGVVIRYGKNLVDLKQDESMANVYTEIMPYWYGEVDEIPTLVTLPEKMVHVENNFNFKRVLLLDMSSEFQEMPFVVDLRALTNKWITENKPAEPSVSFDVSFAQLEQTEEYKNLVLLERVELFDTVGVEYPEFNISTKAKVTKTTYDAVTGKYTSITLGDIHSTMSETVANQAESMEETVNNIKSEIQNASDEATKWITNGRGYMVAVKNEIGQWMEICSLDTPDIAKALNVWRWNNGGFGHSSHGYNGPYDLAITQDGRINADFITTGNLTADLIRSGTLYLGGKSYGNIILYTYDEETDETLEYGYIGKRTSISSLKCNRIENFVNIENESYALYPEIETGLIIHRTIIIGLESTYPPNIGDNVAMIVYSDEGYLNPDPNPDPDGDDILQGPYYGLIVNTSGKGMYVDRFYSSSAASTFSISKDYGTRILSAPSSTSNMIEDIGEGETDENGKCYLYFDDVFLEAVATNVEYQVFLQKEGPGDIWVSEKSNQYFVVEGTENLKFSWIAKVKKKGAESDRMINYHTATIDPYNYEGSYISDVGQITNKSIETFEKNQIESLENIIKEKEESIYEAIK